MFVIAQRANQLGNRLFLFAHLIACAAEHRVQLLNLGFEEYARYFETTSSDVLCRYPPARSWLPKDLRSRETLSNWAGRIAGSLADGKLKRFQGSAIMVLRSGYDSTLSDPHGEVHLDSETFLSALPSAKLIVFLGPLFRDYSSFPTHAASIREYFRPLAIFRHNVDALMKTLRERCDVIVGLHIRRGDYRGFMDGQFFYTLEHYLKWMEHVRALFRGKVVSFLVCSNESQPDGAFSRFNVFFGTGHFIEDLYALARCDFILSPPSTFSAWASFYGQVPLRMVMSPGEEPTIEEFAIWRA